jgi:Barrel-sandwich domain of CusB or HlyD membrane-fusion
MNVHRGTRRSIASFAVMTGLLCSCGGSGSAPTSTTPTEPPTFVTLPAEAARAAGIETAVVGTASHPWVITLTGTLAARPWTPEEQGALSDADAADAKLRLAEADFERQSRLYDDGMVARQGLDAARAERDQARAGAAQVDAIRANLGLPAAASTLERQASLWGLASLPEVDLPRVNPGETVEVSTAAFPLRPFRGHVVDVSRSANPQTRDFTVRIAIDDPAGSLRPQMLARFAIVVPAPGAIAVPSAAVLLEGDGSYVYIAEGDTFRRQRIRTGVSSAELVQVAEGLSPGQSVVVHGAQILEAERLKSALPPPHDD